MVDGKVELLNGVHVCFRSVYYGTHWCQVMHLIGCKCVLCAFNLNYYSSANICIHLMCFGIGFAKSTSKYFFKYKIPNKFCFSKYLLSLCYHLIHVCLFLLQSLFNHEACVEHMFFLQLINLRMSSNSVGVIARQWWCGRYQNFHVCYIWTPFH